VSRPRRTLPESITLPVSAVAAGLLAGGGVWGFKRLVLLLGGWAAILPEPWQPLVGGLLVGLLARYLIGAERFQGVPGIMESVALAGGRLRWWRTPQKAVGAAISIGGGAAVGPEDPSVQIGANAGSMVGQALRLSEARMRALVAGGAAAGIAAAFNAPIAGVFFAIEVILGDLGGGLLSVVILSAFSSSALVRALGSGGAEFHLPPWQPVSVLGLPLFAALGILAGAVAGGYVRALDAARGLFERSRIPAVARPAVAGLAVGLVAMALPEVRGVGYASIQAVLEGAGGRGAGLLLALLAAKLVLTPVCIGGGFLGGVFAPALFLGAMLGGAFGAGVGSLAGEGHAPAFAIAGMAAVLAGAVRAPLTATLLVFELTDDYRVLLPVLLSIVVSQWIAQRIDPHSVYTAALARRGVRLGGGRDLDLLASIPVERVMVRDVPRIPETTPLPQAASVLMGAKLHGAPVFDEGGGLVGVVTTRDIDRGLARGAQRVAEVCSRDLVVAHADESIGEALRRMAPRDIGRLPVVARDDPRRFLGLLRRVDLLRAYEAAAVQRASARQGAGGARIAATGAEVIEETVEEGAPADGKLVKEIPWPRGCIVATVRRGAELLVPRGDTALRGADVLLLVLQNGDVESARALCRAPSA